LQTGQNLAILNLMENPEIINLTEEMEIKEKKMWPFRNERLKMLYETYGDFIPVVSTLKAAAEAYYGRTLEGEELSYRTRADRAIISAGATFAIALEYFGYRGSMPYVAAGMASGLSSSEFIEAMLKEGPASMKNIAETAAKKHPEAADLLGNFADYCVKKREVFLEYLGELKENLKNNGTFDGSVKGTF